MVWVNLGLGSNNNPKANLASGLDALLLQFRDMALSSVYKSQARGHEGADYLNMAVGFDTDMPLQELALLLKKIEDKHGRIRNTPLPSTITLDIDVLTYGDKVGRFDNIILPRPEILEAAYVLKPLSQVASRYKHPVLKKTYAELWKDFTNTEQVLTPVGFTWHERVISKGA
ncbi:MAG: 2-amino-4-hydroxy-6-hydroxymethyldihydropteridine diphosphokinase [Pseudomonadota bacterium]